VRLHKEQQLFSSIDAFISGQIDPGLFVIEGKLMEGVSKELANAAIWKELELLKKETVQELELTKLKNKVEASLTFSECSILNKAINLAYFELLGDAAYINKESEFYQNVDVKDIKRVANEIFQKENCSELVYLKK
jgi:predicted Zn-dependent peptidase